MNRNILIEIAGMLVLNIIFSIIVHAIAPIAPFWTCFFLVLTGYFFFKLISYQRTKLLGKIGIGFVCAYAVFLFITATFPMTTKMFPWGVTKTDYAISKIADSVDIKADLIYNAAMNQALDDSLKEYKRLLRIGEPEKALVFMENLRKKWDKEAIQARLQAEKDTVKRMSQTNPDMSEPSEREIDKMVSQYKAGDSPFFTLEPRQRTNWIKISNFKKGQLYSNGDYWLVPASGEPILFKQGEKPNFPNQAFYFKSLNKTVSIQLEIS